MGSHVDITAQKVHEAEIERLQRLYLALSQVNQLITRVKTREELLCGVCQMLVQFGYLKMAWIGWRDPQTLEVKSVAQYGDEGGYLNQITIIANDQPEGGGPTGKAVKEGRTFVYQDFLKADATTPWHAAGFQQGFGSSAAFPIQEGGKVCGALTVYASELDFFRDKEVLLFEEAAMDVSFALDHLEHEKQRQRAEEALLKSENLYRSLFENMLNGFAYCQMIFENGKPADFIYLAVNEAFRLHTGIENVLGKRAAEVMPGIRELDSQLLEIFGRVAIGGQPERFEYFVEALKMWFSISVYSPAREYFVSVFDVITERKRIEADLHQSESRLNEAQRIALLGNWERDHLKNTLLWSDETFRIFEIPRERVFASYETFQAYVHPEDRDAVKAAYELSLETRSPYGITHRLLMPDGRIKFVHEQCEHYYNSEGKPLRSVGVVQDITQQKLLEEELRQAQKLESIGQLAGGIAHDFNNILAAIMMQLGFLQQNSRLDPGSQETLNELMVGAKRAASLIRQLLMFSRRSILEIKVLDLNELVSNLLKMLGRVIGEHICLRFDRKASLPAVEADPGMLEQVLMNLAVNARDAMPKGGRLSISIDTVQVDKERIKGNIEVKPGLFVCLTVADTGCGMNEATLKRIFEPFFTTKESGKGTGLGLATVYGIVAQHKGWVEVESELDKGTTFSVFIPASTKCLDEMAPDGKMDAISGHETILLVEDEAILRRVVAQGLRLLGYRILEAGNGLDAMKIWQEQSHQIDLLFSDMVMPEGMTGLDLAEKFRELIPNLKVIISSGYNAEMVEQGSPASRDIVYLQKPYQVEVLSKVIRDCLDRR